jgi:phosphoribosyl-ATP pyrophosphohydrolase/phosphoribosyl-AMP cyclohydrolase
MMDLLTAGAVGWGADGLVPGVVQDVTDGRVLMVGWLDAEALAATVATGLVHFHSRSRGRLWQKGETSGHSLRLRGLALDCDGDAILLSVEPTGPTCHTGARSCFDAGTAGGQPGFAADGTEASQRFAWLETLWTTIGDRAERMPPDSHTAGLLRGGVDAVARKVAEEAVEVVMAAKDDARAEAADAERPRNSAALAGEMADLWYHALVLCAERGLPPSAVLDVLRGRHAP